MTDPRVEALTAEQHEMRGSWLQPYDLRRVVQVLDRVMPKAVVR